MSYCNQCGKEVLEGAAFCSGCGAQLGAGTPVVHPGLYNEADRQEEREFLETTHRLLRWEHKAWNIASKVWIIVGIVFAAWCMLFALLGAAIISEDDPYVAGTYFGIFLMYAIGFGGMYIGFGIVNKKAGQKLPQYIDTVYTDFSLAYHRCNSVGMLVFTVIFGAVSPIFFIINFARMKANRAVIDRIMKNQGVQG